MKLFVFGTLKIPNGLGTIPMNTSCPLCLMKPLAPTIVALFFLLAIGIFIAASAQVETPEGNTSLDFFKLVAEDKISSDPAQWDDEPPKKTLGNMPPVYNVLVGTHRHTCVCRSFLTLPCPALFFSA